MCAVHTARGACVVPMLCLVLIRGEARREEARQGKREKEMQKKAERARGKRMREEGKRGAKWGGPWGSRGGRHVRIAHPLAALLPPCPWREGDACMCAGGGAMLGEGGCCGVLARCCAAVVLLLLVSTERPTEIAEFLSPGRGPCARVRSPPCAVRGRAAPSGQGVSQPGPMARVASFPPRAGRGRASGPVGLALSLSRAGGPPCVRHAGSS